MSIRTIQAAAQANFIRFQQGNTKGHYESFFIRANHPTEAKAFWIRYTIFSPKDRPEASMGELWAVYFDTDKDPHSAKVEFPIALCQMAENHFSLQIGDKSHIVSNKAVGEALDIHWDLEYQGEEAPLFLLPLNFYTLPFPKAKSIVSLPLAKFNGQLKVGKKTIKIEDWVGSQNHNWGEKHTDYYAWGQVAGFDNAPDSFLELISAQLQLGPIRTPLMTLLVLRHEGKEYTFNGIQYWFKSKAKFKYFDWHFECENSEVKIKGNIQAPAEYFAGLRYPNPSGGDKYCLNSKLAQCQLNIKIKSKQKQQIVLQTEHRAAFEILTDDKNSHGVEIFF